MLAMQALTQMTLEDFCDAIASRVIQQQGTTTPANGQYDNLELITPTEALTFTGKGPTDLWAGVKKGIYPAPVSRPGKARRWRREDWLSWQRENTNRWNNT